MKKLAVIILCVTILPICYFSFIEAGYSWLQAVGFVLIIIVMAWVVWIIIKIDEERRGLNKREDNYYE